MKLTATFTITASIIALANAGCDNWSFKCANTVFMCGIVERENTCEAGKGAKHYQTASDTDCIGLIKAVKTNNYNGYVCPLDNSDNKNHTLSHWSNYCVGTKCDVKEDGGKRCTGTCKIDNEEQEDPEPEDGPHPPTGGGGGDPHFRTYDGTSYSYHGECDLVMARSNEFGPDKVNLDLHIRTKSMGAWSLISNAALRIGRDVLEFENDGSFYINGAEASLPNVLDGRYTVDKEIIIFEQKHEDGEVEMVERHVMLVDLGEGEEIRMTMVKGMIYVRVNAYIAETEGMLGVHGSKGMVARDGSVLQDETAMGEMWQVRDTEAMLFREPRFPQYPAMCIPPAVDGRRLRISAMERERAEKACESTFDSTRHFCIEDVLLSGDVKVAAGYMFGEAF